MSILITMRQIASPIYFPMVKSEKVLSKTFYTMYFRQMQQQRLSHGVWNKSTMVHTTPKSDSGFRKTRTTICLNLSCGRATYIFIFMFLYTEDRHVDVIPFLFYISA